MARALPFKFSMIALLKKYVQKILSNIKPLTFKLPFNHLSPFSNIKNKEVPVHEGAEKPFTLKVPRRGSKIKLNTITEYQVLDIIELLVI